jgi:hypothetical protein
MNLAAERGRKQKASCSETKAATVALLRAILGVD